MNKVIATVASSRVRTIATRAALIAIATASLSLVSMSASATAAAQLGPPQQRVDFDDLDLTKVEDTQRLYRRLRTAAAEVCSQFANHSGARMRLRRLNCEARALGDAVATIDHPSLTALHTAKSDTKLAQGKSQAQPHS